MTERSFAARAAAWAAERVAAGKGDFLADPFSGMAEAGLFRVGIPAPYGDDGGYGAIAATEAALVAATGLPRPASMEP